MMWKLRFLFQAEGGLIIPRTSFKPLEDFSAGVAVETIASKFIYINYLLNYVNFQIVMVTTHYLQTYSVFKTGGMDASEESITGDMLHAA